MATILIVGAFYLITQYTLAIGSTQIRATSGAIVSKHQRPKSQNPANTRDFFRGWCLDLGPWPVPGPGYGTS